MTSDRCIRTSGARSFICCVHYFHCEAQGCVGRLHLATKPFTVRQSFAEAKKLDQEYERMSNKDRISTYHLTAHHKKQTLKPTMLFHTNKTSLPNYDYSIYSNTVTIQIYLHE